MGTNSRLSESLVVQAMVGGFGSGDGNSIGIGSAFSVLPAKHSAQDDAYNEVRSKPVASPFIQRYA